MTSSLDAPSFADYSALVVDPALEDLLPVILTMSRLGLHVTAAASFGQAKQLLSSSPPSILLAAVRLGIYNGLHLVLHGKAVRPRMAALVASPASDPVLRADAEAMGATFLVKPIPERELIGVIMQTLFREDLGAQPIQPPFERRLDQRRTTILSFAPDRRAADRRRIVCPASLGDKVIIRG
ncbi:MAG TPA: hypothetical protein VMO26_23260 [Vicinamibacterales bacterium]|nr:hypothetical protein [Vicinamibacterales bacterium]